jgi:hypothetical protein
MSRPVRLAVAAGFIVVAIVAFIIAKPGSDNKKSSTVANTATSTATTPAGTATTTTPAAPAIPTVVVKNAKPASGIKKLSFKLGDQITFRVVSDTGDEIHVHGYDFHKTVKAGGQVVFSFKGKIDGVFIIELESRAEQIAELRVKP